MHTWQTDMHIHTHTYIHTHNNKTIRSVIFGQPSHPMNRTKNKVKTHDKLFYILDLDKLTSKLARSKDH